RSAHPPIEYIPGGWGGPIEPALWGGNIAARYSSPAPHSVIGSGAPFSVPSSSVQRSAPASSNMHPPRPARDDQPTDRSLDLVSSSEVPRSGKKLVSPSSGPNGTPPRFRQIVPADISGASSSVNVSQPSSRIGYPPPQAISWGMKR